MEAGGGVPGVADAAVLIAVAEAMEGEPGAEDEGVGQEAGGEEQLREHPVLAEDDGPDAGREADALREEEEEDPVGHGRPARRCARKHVPGAQRSDADGQQHVLEKTPMVQGGCEVAGWLLALVVSALVCRGDSHDGAAKETDVFEEVVDTVRDRRGVHTGIVCC